MIKHIANCAVGTVLTLMAMHCQAAAPIKDPTNTMAYGIELYSVTPSSEYRGAFAGFAQYGDYSLIVGVPAYVNIDKKYQYGYDTTTLDYEELQTPFTLRVEKPLQKGLEWVFDLEYILRRVENGQLNNTETNDTNAAVKSWTYSRGFRLGLAQKLSQNVKISFLPQVWAFSPETLAENKSTNNVKGHAQAILSGTKVALKYTL